MILVLLLKLQISNSNISDLTLTNYSKLWSARNVAASAADDDDVDEDNDDRG